MRPKSEMHDYQNRLVSIFKEQPYAAMWAFMGAGKSTVALTAVDELYKECRLDKVLVISTVRNVDVTWPEEPGEWEHLSHLTVTPLRGTPKQRSQALFDPNPFHAINVENLKWLVSQFKVSKNRKTGVLSSNWPYDTVVLDESGLFRKHDTNRFKSLRKMRPFINRIYQLTGTPAPKGLENLWSQVFLMDQGQRLGRTLTSYRQQYFYPNPNGYGYLPRETAQTDVLDKLKDICFTLKEDDYLTLPEMLFRPIKCHLSPAAMEKYRELEKERILEIGDDIIKADQAGVLYGKLLQLANGAYYTDLEGNWSTFHDVKLDVLQQVVEEAAGKPLLIAYNFKSDEARLRQRFPTMEFIKDHKGKASSVLQQRWNNDDIPLLAAQPKSAGHGLNMQKGNAHGIVWFGLNPDLELYLQLNKRIHRQGQRFVTVNHIIMAEGTIDEKVVATLNSKSVTQDDIMNAFRLYVKKTSRPPPR